MWGLEQSQAFLPAGSLTCFPLPRIQEMLFYLHTKRGPESTVKAQHFAMGHLPCPHITIYSRWFSSRILITSGPLNLIIFILPLTQPKVISTGRYHESCWVFPMKERSMIEVKKKVLCLMRGIKISRTSQNIRCLLSRGRKSGAWLVAVSVQKSVR